MGEHRKQPEQGRQKPLVLAPVKRKKRRIERSEELEGIPGNSLGPGFWWW
jgi:hypothetical protein